MEQNIIDKFSKYREKFEKLELEGDYEQALRVVEEYIAFLQGHLAGNIGIMDRPISESVLRDLKIIRKVFKLNIENQALKDQLANHTYKINQLENQLKDKSELR